MKQIQFTKGCPNNCEYCYEPNKMEYLNPEIPEGDLQILDMNFLANPHHKQILIRLISYRGNKELVCGVDFRLMTQEIANLLKAANFIKIRWAWDYFFKEQIIHQNIWKIFRKAKYKSEDLSIFMLANWKVPFKECCKKLDLIKIWNTKVNDCCYDGGYLRVYKTLSPLIWSINEIKDFRSKCRKHNQMVIHKLDPEVL